MAKKVMTLLVDDLDGTELGDKGVTVEFGWLGQPYEIDLSDEHATAMKDALGMYVQHARRLDRGRNPNSRRGRGRPAGGASAESKEARAWLIENGHLAESHRGRISNAMWELYRNRGQMSLSGSSSGDTATAESRQTMTEPDAETPSRSRTRNSRSAAKAPEGQQVPESVSA